MAPARFHGWRRRPTTWHYVRPLWTYPLPASLHGAFQSAYTSFSYRTPERGATVTVQLGTLRLRPIMVIESNVCWMMTVHVLSRRCSGRTLPISTFKP
ncbi:uncharacterized protein BO72DRAFT_453211 [Aspergillus fijiensis CBS 313.89]|uniref:Uncharacterized protein n=1 Tax=Aspergillus fijiensis CBS 313.89 TaxID=1448319 RepID=A0A8G1VUA5_9EURO|nr:uncharacterized protein BO72DRAFT_453211 [Aspergillus fijiensis CBS 313.89]RAK71926.1 hypothetical protein BO72DRAFT_453211 [Aspergillus fijiensis CBS 313.89]